MVATRMYIPQQARRIGPLGLIIFLHLAFIYALQSSLLKQTAHAMPAKEVSAFFIEPAPPAPAPTPRAAPKTVPIAKKTLTPRPSPVIDIAPSPQAISTPPQAPSPPAPAQAAVPSAAAAPAAPAMQAAPAPPKTISSGVAYIEPPRPRYPSLSRRMGEEGRVILRVLINVKGHPEQVAVQQSSGSVRLDEAGRQAVLSALFQPHIDNGQAVAVYVITPIVFELNN